MFKDTKNFIIIALLAIIGILLFLRQCGEPNPGGGTIVKTETVVKWDSIPVPYEVIKLDSVFFPKYINIQKTDTIYDGTLCEFERTYADSTVDSNITIFSNIKTIGILKSMELSYRLKVPQTILKTIETTTTVAIPNKWDLMLNAGAGGNANYFDFHIGGALRIKKGYYGYSYGIINKTHNAKVGLVLFSSRK